MKQQMDNAKQELKSKNKTYFYKNDEALRSPMEEMTGGSWAGERARR